MQNPVAYKVCPDRGTNYVGVTYQTISDLRHSVKQGDLNEKYVQGADSVIDFLEDCLNKINRGY